MKRNYIREFIHQQSAGGILLLVAACAALVVENTGLQQAGHAFLHFPLGISVGELAFSRPLHFWINDGLMAIFFLLIGLELKRERLEGHLASLDQCILPSLAACGGVIAPAVIFWWLNHGDRTAMRGWAIPTATDIAFALCVMQLLGNRVPQALKVTLVTIAIVDDLIAVLIIALFYTSQIDLHMLALALALMGLLTIFNRMGIRPLWPYLGVGVLLWVCVMQSGIHATIAGVALAMFIPLRTASKTDAPARRLESALHPWISFLIMPLFAFANAGISFAGLSLGALGEPVTLGILLGLVFGKQIGVMLASALSIRAGLCRLPYQTSCGQYYAMAVLCGIGFTMSLFIGGLAYPNPDYQQAVRLGVLTGSLITSLAGYALLCLLDKRKASSPDKSL